MTQLLAKIHRQMSRGAMAHLATMDRATAPDPRNRLTALAYFAAAAACLAVCVIAVLAWVV